MTHEVSFYVPEDEAKGTFTAIGYGQTLFNLLVSGQEDEYEVTNRQVIAATLGDGRKGFAVTIEYTYTPKEGQR